MSRNPLAGVDRMSEAEVVAELERIIAVEAKAKSRVSWCPQSPTPKQAEFLACDALECLFGGAAGGAKTSALLMSALQYVDVPGYSAVIFRKSFADLARADAIMDRAQRWLAPTSAAWNGEKRCWTFPSGARLEFGYLDNENDVYRYQGGAWQFAGFDELTQLSEKTYTYVIGSRMRRLEGSKVPIRARSTSNPGGVGHDWVKARFVDSTDPQRRFIPSFLADNPHIDAVEYRKGLALLDETTRLQLEEGVWIQDAEGLVFRFPESGVVEHIPKCENYVLGIDYGTKSESAFVVLGYRPNDNNVYVIEEMERRGLYPDSAAEIVRDLESKYHFQKIVGDHQGLGAGFVEQARRRWGLPIENADKNNRRGYLLLLAGALERGRIMVHTSCVGLVGELRSLRWDKDRTDVAPRQKDHITDACMYAWRQCHNYLEKALPPAKTHAETLKAQYDTHERQDPYYEPEPFWKEGQKWK